MAKLTVDPLADHVFANSNFFFDSADNWLSRYSHPMQLSDGNEPSVYTPGASGTSGRLVFEWLEYTSQNFPEPYFPVFPTGSSAWVREVHLIAGESLDSFGQGSKIKTDTTIVEWSNDHGNTVTQYELVKFEADTALLVSDFYDVSMAKSLEGNDDIQSSNSNDIVNGFTGNDTINAGYGFDTVYGGFGNDSIQGGFNGDQIYGEDGNDDLRGGNGLDLIDGAAGNDTIRGAKGRDTLTGGDGSDVFIFEKELDGVINIDTITDFVSGTDRIELSAAIFGSLGPVGSHVGLSQNLLYSATTGVLSYDTDGAGATAPVAFAILGASNHPANVGADFWIVV